METKEIRIKNDEIRFIHSDELLKHMKDAGSVEIKRASHVEPNENGKWTVDMSPVGGPKFGDFSTRKEALDAEVDWLNENKIPQSK